MNLGNEGGNSGRNMDSAGGRRNSDSLLSIFRPQSWIGRYVLAWILGAGLLLLACVVGIALLFLAR